MLETYPKKCRSGAERLRLKVRSNAVLHLTRAAVQLPNPDL